MSGVKRKSTESASGSLSKSAKKQKRLPSPNQKPLSTEFVLDSSDDETVKASARAKYSATKPTKTSISSSAARQSTPIQSNSSKKPKYQSSVHSSTGSESSASEDSNTGERSKSASNSEASRTAARVQNTEEEDESATDSEGTDEERSQSEESIVEREPVQVHARTLQELPSPYHPPPGFEAATVRSSSIVQHLFAKENLQRKQIWHITAPASVPISSIKEVPIRKVDSGGSILSYKDADYGLVTEADENPNEKVLLIPSSEDNGYRVADANITRTVHLQQIVKLPSLSSKPGVLVNGTTETVKTHVKVIRQQPEGLRMRYRPFGDESSSEDSDTAPQFRMPPIISPAKTSREPKPVGNSIRRSPPRAKIAQKKGAEAMRENVDTPKTPKSILKLSSKKSKSELATAKETPSNERPPSEAVDQKAKSRSEKTRRKDRRDSESKDTWEAEQARRILASSKQAKENTIPTATISVGKAQNGQEPEKLKTKRKKRKSEATEEA
ncbi:MAG: hypothetical protein Q9225_007555 [Loekoesia sp. 1 TL-2023]